MIKIENSFEYAPGTKVWWYGDGFGLRHGIVRQVVTAEKETTACIDEEGDLIHTVPLGECWPTEWMARLMANTCYLLSAFWTFIIWSLAWMGLEVLLYGECQPRVVDDIISIPVIVMLYLMFRFKAERDRLKK